MRKTNKSILLTIALVCFPWVFAGYSALQAKYSGKGLQVIHNILKDTLSFEEAIQALKEGHRIRRKTEKHGFTKIVIMEGKNQKEKFGTYWTSSPNQLSNHCSFEMADVIADDWIIDDEGS